MKGIIFLIQRTLLEKKGYEFVYSYNSVINGKKALVFYFQKQTYILPTGTFGSCLKVKNKKLVL